MVDLDIPLTALAESTRRVVRRAIEEANKRNHLLLSSEHVSLALAESEWAVFSEVMRDVGLEAEGVMRSLRERLETHLTGDGGEPWRATPVLKLVFKLAFHRASLAGRSQIEPLDLFAALFEPLGDVPAAVIRQHGAEPEAIVAGVSKLADLRRSQS